MPEAEHHKSHRVGWLRAAVLGANDGIVSTASLIMGVAAAGTTRENILVAGVAGLAAGAMSMAAGEFVSVSSQADTERADLELEKESLENNYAVEQQELTEIYRGRGLSEDLAGKVADQLMQHDALEAHARDEIGISKTMQARPTQAAVSSGLAFSVGAALPLLAAWAAPGDTIMFVVPPLSLVFLAALGAFAAYAGGAPMTRGALRVTFWSALAMVVTTGVGELFNIAV
jgi:VIT1/CCC1 family predicted Fe2+/Mn2+ transporter